MYFCLHVGIFYTSQNIQNFISDNLKPYIICRQTFAIFRAFTIGEVGVEEVLNLPGGPFHHLTDIKYTEDEKEEGVPQPHTGKHPIEIQLEVITDTKYN